MGAVGADAPIKIVLAKKYTVIVFCMSAWHVDSAPMMLNIFLRLCVVKGRNHTAQYYVFVTRHWVSNNRLSI